MRNLDAPMVFYADKSAYRFRMCDNGCAYAVAENSTLCKSCASSVESQDANRNTQEDNASGY